MPRARAQAIAELRTQLRRDSSLATCLRVAPTQTLATLPFLDSTDRAALLDGGEIHWVLGELNRLPLSGRSGVGPGPGVFGPGPPGLSGEFGNVHVYPSEVMPGMYVVPGAGPFVPPGKTARSQKQFQLTGDWDLQANAPTSTLTNRYFNVRATDLGIPVQYNGTLYLFFGDTHTNYLAYALQDFDAIGTLDLVLLNFPGPSTVFPPPGTSVFSYVDINPPVSLGSFCVPTGGFSANGYLYLFYQTDPFNAQAQRSVLARTTDPIWQGFQWVADVSYWGTPFQLSPAGSNFIQVAAVVSPADWPGSSQYPNYVWLFGAGTYRQSNPYLAFVHAADVENIGAWQYFTGNAGGELQSSFDSSQGQPVFVDLIPSVGELSVTWNPFLKKWLAVYLGPSGGLIQLRWADNPWGPWFGVLDSSGNDAGPLIIFDPVEDFGSNHFIHIPGGPLPSDGEIPGNPQGGPYAPYVLPILGSFTTGGTATETSPAWSTIFFTMSTFNPYQVVIMSCTLEFYP